MTATATGPPRVSIVMPAFNSAQYIVESIGSIQAQTEQDWELIVVDDGSTDGTRAAVAALAASDRRIHGVHLDRNRGPGPARNAGMALVTGRYLAFQDSQDLWPPDKLEVQLAYMRASGAALSFTAYSRVDERGRSLGGMVHVPARVDYRALLRNTIISMITVMVDREQLGPLELPDLPQHEDLVLWYRVLKRGVVAHGIDRDLARYRILHASASRDKWRSARRMWRVYRVYERLPLHEAAWCFAHYAVNATLKYRGLGAAPRR